MPSPVIAPTITRDRCSRPSRSCAAPVAGNSTRAGARIHPLARRLPGRHAGRTAHRRSGGGGRKHEQLQLRRRSWCCAMRQSSATRRVIWTWRGSPWTRRARLIASAVGCPMALSVLHIADPGCSRFCIRRPGRLRTGRLSLASGRLHRRFQAQSVTGRSVIVLYLNRVLGNVCALQNKESRHD